MAFWYSLAAFRSFSIEIWLSAFLVPVLGEEVEEETELGGGEKVVVGWGAAGFGLVVEGTAVVIAAELTVSITLILVA